MLSQLSSGDLNELERVLEAVERVAQREGSGSLVDNTNIRANTATPHFPVCNTNGMGITAVASWHHGDMTDLKAVRGHPYLAVCPPPARHTSCAPGSSFRGMPDNLTEMSSSNLSVSVSSCGGYVGRTAPQGDNPSPHSPPAKRQYTATRVSQIRCISIDCDPQMAWGRSGPAAQLQPPPEALQGAAVDEHAVQVSMLAASRPVCVAGFHRQRLPPTGGLPSDVQLQLEPSPPSPQLPQARDAFPYSHQRKRHEEPQHHQQHLYSSLQPSTMQLQQQQILTLALQQSSHCLPSPLTPPPPQPTDWQQSIPIGLTCSLQGQSNPLASHATPPQPMVYSTRQDANVSGVDVAPSDDAGGPAIPWHKCNEAMGAASGWPHPYKGVHGRQDGDGLRVATSHDGARDQLQQSHHYWHPPPPPPLQQQQMPQTQLQLQIPLEPSPQCAQLQGSRRRQNEEHHCQPTLASGSGSTETSTVALRAAHPQAGADAQGFAGSAGSAQPSSKPCGIQGQGQRQLHARKQRDPNGCSSPRQAHALRVPPPPAAALLRLQMPMRVLCSEVHVSTAPLPLRHHHHQQKEDQEKDQQNRLTSRPPPQQRQEQPSQQQERGHEQPVGNGQYPYGHHQQHVHQQCQQQSEQQSHEQQQQQQQCRRLQQCSPCEGTALPFRFHTCPILQDAVEPKGSTAMLVRFNREAPQVHSPEPFAGLAPCAGTGGGPYGGIRSLPGSMVHLVGASYATEEAMAAAAATIPEAQASLLKGSGGHYSAESRDDRPAVAVKLGSVGCGNGAGLAPSALDFTTETCAACRRVADHSHSPAIATSAKCSGGVAGAGATGKLADGTAEWTIGCSCGSDASGVRGYDLASPAAIADDGGGAGNSASGDQDGSKGEITISGCEGGSDVGSAGGDGGGRAGRRLPASLLPADKAAASGAAAIAALMKAPGTAALRAEVASAGALLRAALRPALPSIADVRSAKAAAVAAASSSGGGGGDGGDRGGGGGGGAVQRTEANKYVLQFKGSVRYAATAVEVDWMCGQLLEARPTVVGLDMEWRPQYIAGSAANPVALLQICYATPMNPPGQSPGRSGYLRSADGHGQPALTVATAVPAAAAAVVACTGLCSFAVDVAASAPSVSPSRCPPGTGPGVKSEAATMTGAALAAAAAADAMQGRHCCCLLLHIIHSGITPRLRALLEAEDLVKVGVNITGDANKLRRDYGVEMRGVTELDKLANERVLQHIDHVTINTEYRSRWSLSALVETVLQRHLPKPNNIRCGNWEHRPLNGTQQRYAALDAYAGLAVWAVLKRMPLHLKTQLPAPTAGCGGCNRALDIGASVVAAAGDVKRTSC